MFPAGLAGAVLNYGYTHDGAGNVETISGLPKPDFFPRLTDLTYNANRMATQNTDWIGAGVVLPSPAAVYAYDNAGNIVSDGLHTDYFYNQNNRLIRVEIDGLTIAEYAYDAFERRVKKVADGVTTHFHYDLNGLLISETDGNGNPRKDYVYLNGEPVAMKTYGGSAGWYWFVNDHLGTPQKMVDKSGSVVWAAAYAPFGEARVYSDEITNNLRFPGQYYDVETGLHYNWHRYYDPGTGRYLRADPIGLAGGINPYVYAAGNPTNFIDLDGLKIITGSRKEIEEKVGVPSFSLSTMDFYELMVMAMYPEVLVPMMIGEGIIKGCVGKKLHTPAGPMKGRRIGHTFTKHGSHNTEELLQHAKGSGQPVGQWIDDSAAEAFIADHLDELANGPKSFDLPEGLGRLVHPDGSMVPAKKARLVPSKSGVKTAYPEE